MGRNREKVGGNSERGGSRWREELGEKVFGEGFGKGILAVGDFRIGGIVSQD